MALLRPAVLLTYILVCMLTFDGVSSYKILVVPGLSVSSHYLYMSKISEYLANAGNDVTFLLGENHNDLKKTPQTQKLFTFEMYHTKADKSLFDRLDSMFIAKAFTGQIEMRDMTIFADGLRDDCQQLLEDERLFERLESAKFDIIVSNNVALCHVLIAQKLSLPFVTVSTNRPISFMDAYYTNMPTPLSYVPAMMSGLSDRMDFLQRVKNFMVQIVASTFFNLMVLPAYDEFKQIHNIKPEIGMRESLGSAELYLFGVDWALEFPRPIMPNSIFLGGLMAKESSPLSDEWEEFVNSADNGIVVFSFGSVANPGVNIEVAEMLTAALARLPQKVVMRYEGETPKSLGNNTKLTKWMPQNDLLGNPRTKAFVSHGGMNGIYESLCHGVPMVGVPLYGDHHDNFARLTSKGMAVTVNIATLTSDELYKAITTVVEDQSYKENAMRLARIHRDKPMLPGDTAVFWIEHVIKHGGQHLRAEAFNLNIFQYFLLDVMAFLLLVFLTIIFVLKKIFTFLCNLCCKRTDVKEKEN
ncbi:UDP-glucuronosyltransferase 2C1-like [Glandiceps talaboti]